MSTDGLVVHSLGEASLYLMLARCRTCTGVVVPTLDETKTRVGTTMEVRAACRECGQETHFQFDLSRVQPGEAAIGLAGWSAMAEKGEAPPINSSGSPSRVIDLPGWLTLHQLLTNGARNRIDEARSTADRTLSRQMLIQASQCLEEALKFYDIDNDLPPEDAFFTNAGRRQFRESPEIFLRTRIASLRAQSTIGRG